MQKLSIAQIFLAFLKLGLTSFGGPVAHLGYFREEFVTRRRVIREEAYADLVALCQFLPGPASSQVGIAVGISQAGLAGGAAAWCGFTLPSALALIFFAYGITSLDEAVIQTGWLHGLKVAAVAVVAQAILGMARMLCPDWPRRGVAIMAALLTLAWPSVSGQMAALVLGAVLGLFFLENRQLAANGPPLFSPGRKLSVAINNFFLFILFYKKPLRALPNFLFQELLL